MFWGKNSHKFQNHKTARKKKEKKESIDLRQCLNFFDDGVISQLAEFRFRK
jgi:hypothetical protein